MQTYFYIEDHKIRYNSISISGYKKSLLLETFKNSLIKNNYYLSLYFGFEMIISGYFNEFWRIIISFVVEYIHISSPNLPKNIHNIYIYYKKLQSKYKKDKINIRNLFEFQKQIIFLIKNLTGNLQKQQIHLSNIIRSTYNNYTTSSIKDISLIKPVFKRLNILIKLCIYNKINNIKTEEKVLNELFNIIGYLLSIDAESYNQDKPYMIRLYHHKNSKINNDITGIIWNIILKNSKYNKFIWNQIVSLYNIYNKKILTKIDKESYLILNSVFFLIYSYEDKPLTRLMKKDISYIEKIYENINLAVSLKKPRKDFIYIEDKTKKSKKNKKKKKNIENKPVVEIEKIVNEKPTIFNNIIENDIYYKSVYEDQNKVEELEIITDNNENLEPDIEFYYDYDKLSEYNINEYNRFHINESKNVILNKTFDEMKNKKDKTIIRKI